MKLATAIGLSAAGVATGNTDGIDYLLVERYDRKITGDTVKRLHQEDFCQALAIPSEIKYQSEGGPSLKDCFALVRQVSSAPVLDLQRLLDAVIFNYLVGNNDAHGKNFSFIYDHEAKTARLAPLYDIVCTAWYPELSKKMAMKIGGEYNCNMVLPRHFEKLAAEAGLAKPLVRRRVPELAEAVMTGLEKAAIEHPVFLITAHL